jgi:flagellar basal-body rod protein FlgG
MNGAFYIGATGLQAQQRGLDVIANNVANINTNAFKRSEVRFSELIQPNVVRDDAQPILVTLPEILTGVQVRTSDKIFEQGNLRETGKPFDIAISGDGFIEVLGPNGQTWLWRGGTVRLNADGLLETENGLVLKAAIEVPQDSISLTIGRDGVVKSVASGASDAVELGAIGLAMPRDPQLIEAVGGGYYRVPDENELETVLTGEAGSGVIVQGSIETSNVELTNEMVTLLLMQRAYGANAQVVQAGDQLMAIANGLRR